MDQILLNAWSKERKCPQCKRRFDKPWLVEVSSQTLAINPEFLFHMHDTHGIPKDIYQNWLTEAIQEKSLTYNCKDSDV